MIDAEVYLHQLFTRDFGAAALDPVPFVAPDIDVKELELLPAVLWTLTGTGETANGPGLWNYNLSVNFFGEGMDAAKAIARAGYDIVHGWDDDPMTTPLTIDGGTVSVVSVDDIDLPSRLAQAMIAGRNLVQYSGTFALALRG